MLNVISLIIFPHLLLWWSLCGNMTDSILFSLIIILKDLIQGSYCLLRWENSFESSLVWKTHDYLNHGIFQIYATRQAATVSIRDNAVSMTRLSVGQNCKFCFNPQTLHHVFPQRLVFLQTSAGKGLIYIWCWFFPVLIL